MKHIYVCSSDIEGLGINIGEDAKKGELVSRIKGEIKFKVNKNKRDALAHPNWVGIEKDQWIDPAKPYKFLNHSCNPSVGVKGQLSLVALRDMKEGDEVTIDYSTIEGDPRWEMNCLCGEANCRKVIRSIHFIPEAQFKKYLPYVSTYFKKIYLKEKKQEKIAVAA
ncbi:MAG: nuclear protein [Parcubacteria group bacterium]|nr:nuclear protein [Parcubacteria group bacterium]